MIYVCQLLCDKGSELPRWQQAFGHRYTGMLTKRLVMDRETARWALVATLEPLPYAVPPDHWPKPLTGIVEMTETTEARYIEGMELNKAVTAERYLRQVWKLTMVSVSELAVIEARLAQPVVGDPDGPPPLYK
ncbi:MAG: hypothetical protein JWN23_1529 [Rhodocyclales bacterium]|nr:hypothetical protein [Rhodocyclales bacterium]